MKIAVVALCAVAGLATAAGSAQAQVIAGWNVAGQWDRGGDYRCDAYWDANRTDCDAAWRTPRGGHRYDQARGYGHDRHRYDRTRYGRGYGHGYGQGGYGHAPAVAYQGAYGRPDLVYGGQGQAYGQGYGHARDPHRVAWCRSAYRSYDAHSGYYRAYSGRLVWCG